MKRTRRNRDTYDKLRALPVAMAALLALTLPAVTHAAGAPRWTVAADSGATTPPPAPAPAPAPAVPPAPAPSPAPADTSKALAPADTTKAPGTLAPAVAPAAAAAPPPLTTQQQKEAEKQAKRQREQEAEAVKQAKHAAKPKDVDPLAGWNKGVSWGTVRAGYAKSAEPGAASGNIGFALGYQRFLTARWALGIIGQGDLLGTFGGASEIEYPITLEMTRHFRWKTELRPYLGAGFGGFYHKYYRTGLDQAHWDSGFYLVGGANAPIGKRSILGIDGRMEFISGDPNVVDPVYGPEQSQLTHYSLKLGYSHFF